MFLSGEDGSYSTEVLRDVKFCAENYLAGYRKPINTKTVPMDRSHCVHLEKTFPSLACVAVFQSWRVAGGFSQWPSEPVEAVL
jgi:hypothetical protein